MLQAEHGYTISTLGQDCFSPGARGALGWHHAAGSGAELGHPRNTFAPNRSFSLLAPHAAGAISNSTQDTAGYTPTLGQKSAKVCFSALFCTVSLSCSVYRPDKIQDLACTSLRDCSYTLQQCQDDSRCFALCQLTLYRTEMLHMESTSSCSPASHRRCSSSIHS